MAPSEHWHSVFWAHSGLGVVTLPDFWATLHGPNLTIIRDEIRTIKERAVYLKSGSILETDYAVMCTGWGDHFGMFDDHHKAKIGLPAYGEDIYSFSDNLEKTLGPDWERYDAVAEIALPRHLSEREATVSARSTPPEEVALVSTRNPCDAG